MREILFFILLTVNTISSATNYYVSNSGNDAANGLTPSTAWKSINRVNSASFKPGDSILFERGGTWFEDLKITASGSSAGQITYSAYGSGDKPIITGKTKVKDWDKTGSWTNLGNNTWRMSFDGPVTSRLWINDVEADRSPEDVLGGVSDKYKWQMWDGLLYVYSSGNPATTYKKIERSSSLRFLGDANRINYITFSHLDIRGWRSTRLYGCSNWVIEHCNWGWDAGSNAFQIYGYNNQVPSKNWIIRHNVFDTGDRASRTRNLSKYNASRYNTDDALSLNSGIQDFEIHDNFFRGWGHTTIAIRSSKSDALKNEAVRIYNNHITHKGMDYGRAFGGGLQPETTNPDRPVEVFNNLIEDSGIQSQINYTYGKIYNNIWTGCRGGGNVATDVGHNIALSGSGGDVPSYMQIYNNIFAYGSYRGLHMPDYPDHSPVMHNVFRNNIFYECGKGDGKHRAMRVGNYGGKSVHSNTFENNIFYSSQSANTIEVYGKGITVADFNALDGSGAHKFKTSGNLAVDPMFVDPANGDFRLKPESPAIGKGLATISDHDHNGVKWQQPVSIGVFEMSGTKDPQPAERFTLEVLINGYGTVNSADEAGVSSITADMGTEVTLEAVPNDGWYFTNWEGDYMGSYNPVTIKMDANKTITAVFAATVVEHTLETDVKGNGSVKSRRRVKELKTVEENAVLMIDATPDDEWEFSHWEGDASGTNNPLEVLMDSDKSIVAVFNQKTYTITLIYEGVGTVDIYPLQESYTSGTMVNLSAIAGQDWQFGEWAGDMYSSDSELSFMVVENTELIVKFNSITTNADNWPEFQKVSIYPNPATDIINISIEGSSDPDGFKIIDFSGKVVHQGLLSSSISDIQIPDFIKSGIYIIELISKKLPFHTQRLVITNKY